MEESEPEIILFKKIDSWNDLNDFCFRRRIRSYYLVILSSFAPHKNRPQFVKVRL